MSGAVAACKILGWAQACSDVVCLPVRCVGTDSNSGTPWVSSRACTRVDAPVHEGVGVKLVYARVCVCVCWAVPLSNEARWWLATIGGGEVNSRWRFREASAGLCGIRCGVRVQCDGRQARVVARTCASTHGARGVCACRDLGQNGLSSVPAGLFDHTSALRTL